MGPRPFLDTNILVRLITRDHQVHLLRAQAFLAEIGQGNQRVVLSDMAIFETVYTLQQHYGHSRSFISEAIRAILDLEHIHIDGEPRYSDIFALYVSHRALSFADCYHAVLARDLAGGEIVSFDRGFDRIPGLTRIAPPLPS